MRDHARTPTTAGGGKPSRSRKQRQVTVAVPAKRKGARPQQDVPAETPTLPPQIATWFARRGWTPRPISLLCSKPRDNDGRHCSSLRQEPARRWRAFCRVSIAHRQRSSQEDRSRPFHALRLSAEGARRRRRAKPDASDRRDGPQDPHRDAYRRYIGRTPPAPAREATTHHADDARTGRVALEPPRRALSLRRSRYDHPR